MKNVYAIGRFRFATYVEYKQGLEDVKKIKAISEELDIRERGVAKRLCTLVREGQITFGTVIGEDFERYLSELAEDETGKRAYLADLGAAWSPRKLVGILCIIVAIVCFLVFFWNEYDTAKKTRELRQLQNNREVSQTAGYIATVLNQNLDADRQSAAIAEQAQGENGQGKSEAASPSAKPPMLADYVGLYQENPDMAGWISIAGTEINYPVMQSKESADFYLHHNFYKQEDANGSIFLDTRNNLANAKENLMIYGHNMKSGLMFGGIKKYLDQNYIKNHKIIEFNTLYEKRKYAIIGVCLAKVAYQDEEVFRYYDFIQMDNRETFEIYKQNVSRMNILEESPDFGYGDELMTLSTCNNYVQDGRLFLLAKRIA